MTSVQLKIIKFFFKKVMKTAELGFFSYYFCNIFKLSRILENSDCCFIVWKGRHLGFILLRFSFIRFSITFTSLFHVIWLLILFKHSFYDCTPPFSVSVASIITFFRSLFICILRNVFWFHESGLNFRKKSKVIFLFYMWFHVNRDLTLCRPNVK